MAKPIKETPVLYGDDARRFLEAIESDDSICRECYGTQEKTVYIDANTVNVIDCPKCARK